MTLVQSKQINVADIMPFYSPDENEIVEHTGTVEESIQHLVEIFNKDFSAAGHIVLNKKWNLSKMIIFNLQCLSQ